MGVINSLDRLSNILAKLTTGDNPKKLLPLIRQIDLIGFAANADLKGSKKFIHNLVKARKAMDRMVVKDKINNRDLMHAMNGIMEALFFASKH